MKLIVHVQATVEIRKVGRFYLVGLPNYTHVKKTKEEAEAVVRRFFQRTARPCAVNVGRIEWTEAP